MYYQLPATSYQYHLPALASGQDYMAFQGLRLANHAVERRLTNWQARQH